MQYVKRALVLGALVLLPMQAQAAVILAPHSTWEYTFTNPTVIDAGWKTGSGLGGPANFLSGQAPFGNVIGPSGPDVAGHFSRNTVWAADSVVRDGDDLWVRKTIDLTGYDLNSLAYGLGVDNGFKLYVNGVQVAGNNAEGYTFRWEYSGAISSAVLQPGLNVIAVELEDHGGLTAFDMEITGTVPEPASMFLLGAGAFGLVARRLRRRA